MQWMRSRRSFTPEFRNRLDNIIWFDHLSTTVIHQVVDKFIVELQVQLDQKGVSLEVSQEARDWLAEKGYDRAMGARPMGRVIQDNLKKPLANRAAVRLAGRWWPGDSVSGQREECADLRFPERAEAQTGSRPLKRCLQRKKPALGRFFAGGRYEKTGNYPGLQHLTP